MNANPQQIVPSVQSSPGTSWAQSMISRMRADMANAPPLSIGTYTKSAAGAGLGYIEGAVVGGTLGAAHARFGLDTKYGPIDCWAAAIAGALGLVVSGHLPELAAESVRVGSQALTVFAFRKSYQIVAHEPIPGGVTGGVVKRITLPSAGAKMAGEDRIEAAAREVLT